ncbi:probable enoyl-CoA hydratase echA8 [Coccomyxa sp. Obi]|nr:probable enoyl-CoA hydratase echA8 [Coccomyxa sp. Obi]
MVTIARPKALNAVSMKAMEEIVHASHWLDRMDSVKGIIITGEGNKAFAAGADIKEMASQNYSEAYKRRFMEGWKELREVRKPIIAAVNGYALGGGCEVAMMADIIIASDNASFGQPEVTLGVIPGMGGTQRLIREVGKSKAMEMILCGRRLTAAEAERAGLVSRVVPQDQLLPEAYKLAAKIGGLSTIAIAKAKDCVHRAYEMSLAEGLRYEQREFWSSFGLEDQREGMRAFLEKREPHFTDS